MIKFSFVIPAYNCKELAQSTIEALKLLKINDDFHFEVILVDDGSTDNTGAYFEEKCYPFDFKYIYLARCDISSRSRARNYGIRAGSGDYIVFIDADIIVQPDYLLELYRYYSRIPDAVVIGQRLLLDHVVSLETVRDENFFRKYKLENSSSNYTEFRHVVFQELSYNMSRLDFPFLFGQTCNIAYSRKDLLLAGGFDESMLAWGIEDIELAYRIFKSGRRFLINPQMYVLHQFHGYQEKISADQDKLEGIKINTELFFRKHPEALPLSRQEAYIFFMNLATRFYDAEKEIAGDYPVIIIQLRNREDIEDIKSQIIKYSGKRHMKLIVYDYLENCGLDLWIQQLGKRNSTPFYYPMSIYQYSKTGEQEKLSANECLLEVV